MIDIKGINAFFTHLTKKEKIVFYVALGFILLAVMDRLIIYPVISKMQLLDEEIKQEQIRIKRDLHILAQEDRIIIESQKYEKYSMSDITAEEAITLTLKEIENLANKAAVYLIDIKPTDIRDEFAYKKYFLNLSCEGQMEQLMDFIYKVESSDNLLKIEKYSISPKSEDSSIAHSSITISKIAIP
ncbi:MAG: hypothetical protein ABIC18_04810 [Candidatus Omnitrophota bacterium]